MCLQYFGVLRESQPCSPAGSCTSLASTLAPLLELAECWWRPAAGAGGYHRVKVGEKFKDGRYTVLHKLGWGHFSTVWMVLDEVTGQQAAMKVGLAVLALAHWAAACAFRGPALTARLWLGMFAQLVHEAQPVLLGEACCIVITGCWSRLRLHSAASSCT